MSPVAPTQNAPSVDEVKQIALMPDPVIRNLRITECYFRLAAAMTQRTGQCANWCTFATWASKQAGQTIRGEDLLDRIESHSKSDAQILHPIRALWSWLVRRGMFNPETRIGRVVHAIHTPFDAFEFSSDAVARGNRKVFEEIGLEFARYLAECPPDASLESDAFQAFKNRLRPGGPPEGQELLRFAFERYQQNSQLQDGRAQHILLANVQIGLHEQTRLQPEIREALESGPSTADELGIRVLKALFPHLRDSAMIRCVARLVQIPASRFKKYVRDLTCRIVTEKLMTLTLPPAHLVDLHRHLEFPFPASLKQLNEPTLLQLLAHFEPAEGTIDNCGAKDWSNLQQRVHFIIHLFRSSQENSDLFAAPFTPDQIRTLMDGKIPAGSL
jgi:hypothetical protein